MCVCYKLDIIHDIINLCCLPPNVCFPWIHRNAKTKGRLETAQAETMMDIGIRRIFSEDHDMFRQTARRFFQEEVVPFHAE